MLTEEGLPAVTPAETPAETGGVLKTLSELYKNNLDTLVPLLGMLRLNNRPYSLKDHFQFEPMFSLRVPKRSVWMCGRQVAKSTGAAANISIRCMVSSAAMQNAQNTDATPLRILYVSPRYDQTALFSNERLSTFINTCPFRSSFIDKTCTDHVLQKSFIGGPAAYLNYAFLDAERIRSFTSDWVYIDEFQDVATEFLPLIESTMAASLLELRTYTGTPKTLDSGIENAWQNSSQAEWVIPCFSCGHWNVPRPDADLMKMIERSGLVCGKCKKPVNPRLGHWYHFSGKEHPEFLGFHISQTTVPLHYGHESKWAELLDKFDNKNNWTPRKFANEVCGISADVGVRLVTTTDIQNASILGPNTYSDAMTRLRDYNIRIIGVDWGGGGEDQVSYTAVAMLGTNDPSAYLDCVYCERFNAGIEYTEEAQRLLTYFREGGCHWFAHDYGGSGSVRETLMVQAGMPISKIMGCLYAGRVSAQRHIVVHHKPAPGEERSYWSVDKPRSLVLQALCVKSKIIRFPSYSSSKDVTCDLLSLFEDKKEVPGGSDIFMIRRNPSLPDDFSHALNFASVCAWHTSQRYPDLSMVNAIKLTAEQLAFASPPHPIQ